MCAAVLGIEVRPAAQLAAPKTSAEHCPLLGAAVAVQKLAAWTCPLNQTSPTYEGARYLSAPLPPI